MAWSTDGRRSAKSVLTLRLDPRTGRWWELDRSVYLTGTAPTGSAGHAPASPVAARLPDGSILIAGGGRYDLSSDNYPATKQTVRYHPSADAWTALPDMPEARAGAAAVVLRDGSVLVVGGRDEAYRTANCDQPAGGLATAVRFVPDR